MPVSRLPPGSAAATSGTWVQGYALGGRRWSHIIDAAQGAPVVGGLRSVTVLARNATLADGWATALCAAGDGAGPALARARGLAALFLVEDGAGLRRIVTGRMAEVLT